jgi:hypothetical protein
MKYSREQIQQMAQRAIEASNTDPLSWSMLIHGLANRLNLSCDSVAQRINLLAMGIGF